MYTSNSTNHLKELLLLSFIIILITLFGIPGFSQGKTFTLQNEAEQRLEINSVFSKDTILNPFKPVKIISGLAISCDIRLNSDSSLIRIILVDDFFNEFLICEFYPLISPSMNFSISGYAEETALLDNIHPLEIRVVTIDASVILKEISLSGVQKYLRAPLAEKTSQQRSEKISILNENIKKHGMHWIAGETSVSKMTYEEKMQMFGGSVPNLQGLEYYSGGIFELPGNTQDASGEKLGLPFAKEFSWRNRHGQDWMTPVRDQKGCGSCWAFGAVGATELLVNLYFNQHLDLDLSEQDIVSCSGGGSCAGGSPTMALMYISNSGIIEESCFEYNAQELPCSYKCINPSENITIGGQKSLGSPVKDLVKKNIIEGPATVTIHSWWHVLTLVGYKVIEEGDNYYNKYEWVTIQPDDPIIGETVWILKNSWGKYWGDNGYLYLLCDVYDLDLDVLDPPVRSLNYNDSDIRCSDEDGDGYYNWGLGPKPAHCPPCPNEPDGDDSDPCQGPMDAYGNIHSLTPDPIANDTSVTAGNPVPDLTAEGENIIWYTDPGRKFPVQTGNIFNTGLNDPGKYIFYATQTISGCESDIKSVILNIVPEILPPVSENVTIYLGDPVPDLLASGENIKWYGDPNNPLYDNRDGQTYKTVQIGDQLWMAENLNYYSEGSCYYQHDSVSYSKPYGRLYQYNAALNSCPTHWHLSTDDDWIELESFLGMNWEEAVMVGWRGDGIGCKLKEEGSEHWLEQHCETGNESGFTALPGGVGNCTDYYVGLGNFTDFIVATPSSIDNTFIRTLDSGRPIQRAYWPKEDFFASVRCVSNPDEPLFYGNSYKPVYVLPGNYTYYITQTISGFESAPDTVIFTILPEVRPPVVESIRVCDGSQVPDFVAEGHNIRWYGYDDWQLTHPVHEGNTFSTGKRSPGDYYYYVTQTNNNIESLPIMVMLLIKPVPATPLVRDSTFNTGDRKIILEAGGEDVRWYAFPDSLYDSRDSRKYNTVRIGNRLWMADNLDIGVRINGSSEQSDNTEIEKYCYGDNPENCGIYGGLYQWNELMNYSVTESSQGICPSGWHVPSNDEWKELEIALGMIPSEANTYGMRGSDQGSKLMAGGTSGFNALMAGKRTAEGTYTNLNSYCTYWNSSTSNRTLSTTFTEIYASMTDAKSNGFSLRCVSDDSSTIAVGNGFVPGVELPGSYQFSVTQTVNGCESPPKNVTLRINPAPPAGESITVCQGEDVPDLTVTGSNIRWYSDSELTSLVHSGNIFATDNNLPGVYIYYVTQTINECQSRDTTVTLTINPHPDRPVTSDVSFCQDNIIPDLTASGNGIQWYSDSELTSPVHSGNAYATGNTLPGVYTFYVTQTINGCPSLSEKVSLTIRSTPPNPVADNVSVCQNSFVPDLVASGSGIRWYSDSLLNHLAGTGNSFKTGINQAGNYRYFITQTVFDCESKGIPVDLSIYEMPELFLGNDTSIMLNETLILNADDNFSDYYWYDGTALPSIELEGEALGAGEHKIWLKITDTNGCTASDTLIVTVMKEETIPTAKSSEFIQIYPNPVFNSLNIKFLNTQRNNVQIFILNETGNVLILKKFKQTHENEIISLDLSSLTQGIYIIKILDDEISWSAKLVK